MIIILNGKALHVEEGMTISRLLTFINAPLKGVAVAKNNEIVSKIRWHENVLEKNDVVEVIYAVQGG